MVESIGFAGVAIDAAFGVASEADGVLALTAGNRHYFFTLGCTCTTFVDSFVLADGLNAGDFGGDVRTRRTIAIVLWPVEAFADGSARPGIECASNFLSRYPCST